MKDEFVRLLSEAGVDFDVDWRELIIVQNVAGVPPPSGYAGIWPWDRGFNFVALDRGSPRYFGKCRPVGDELLERETAIRSCLAQIDLGGLRVAPARIAASDRIAVQLSPFIKGSHYGRVAPKQSARDYLATASAVLAGIGRLEDHAQKACQLTVSPPRMVNLRAAANEALEYVSSHLEERELLDALSSALRDAGCVSSRPQHGDLWPPNLLMGEGQIWVLDLEDWDSVHCPLYDDLTFLRASISLRAGSRAVGIERLAGAEAEGMALRALLADRTASEGIGPAQMDGILAFYVTHRAFNVRRRAGESDSGTHLRDVRYVAERLVSGSRSLLSPA